MLRGRLSDKQATYPDVTRGVNLRKSAEDLGPGEAYLLQNCYFDGGLRKRFGSSRLTSSALASSLGGRGGYKFYPQTAAKARLVAYGGTLSSISDVGVESVITAVLTSDADVHFRTWSITDTCYVANKANTLGSINSVLTFATVTGVNIPASPTLVMPFLDRLFAIQGDRVCSTNPRVDNVWSPNSSTWANYRPFAASGNPTALHIHSGTGASGDPIAQLLIFQNSSVTALTGTDFGSDVTSTTPSTTWDAVLTVLDARTGTSSPRSTVTVPGLGTFWFTQEFNVAWLPFGEKTPRLIADALFTRRTDVYGLNDVNRARLDQVWMVYHDRKLKLGFPVESETFSSIQYWLDLRPLGQAVASILGGEADVQQRAVWTGPHLGRSVRMAWNENEGGDNDALFSIEGDATVGVLVYQEDVADVYTDATGLTAASTTFHYKSFYHNFGMPSYEKYLPTVRFDCTGHIANATVGLNDLHGTLATGMSILQNDGSAFVNQTYGNGFRYGDGLVYGAASGNNVGNVYVESQIANAMNRAIGDAIRVDVEHTTGPFQINSIIPQAQVRRIQQVS